MTIYWVEYRTFDKGTVVQRYNTHTDSAKKVRGDIVSTIGKNRLLSGGIFISGTAKHPIGYIIWNYEMKAHTYTDYKTKKWYVVDSKGNLVEI